MLIDFKKIINGDSPHLIVFLIDSSSSMKKWEKKLIAELNNLKIFFKSFESVILLLRADFSGSYFEREIAKVDDFDTRFIAKGKSIFYYALCRIRESLLFPEDGYIHKLNSMGYNIETTLFVISDGYDEGSEGSGYCFDEAKEAINDLNNNNVDTHILLFGNDSPKAGNELCFKNVYCFEDNTIGLKNMFSRIKQCSQSKITGENNWFNNI